MHCHRWLWWRKYFLESGILRSHSNTINNFIDCFVVVTKNKLLLKVLKFHAILCSGRLPRPNEQADLLFNGSVILPKEYVKYLCVNVDNKMSFKKTFESVLAKISEFRGIFFRIQEVFLFYLIYLFKTILLFC